MTGEDSDGGWGARAAARVRGGTTAAAMVGCLGETVKGRYKGEWVSKVEYVYVT